MNATHPPLSNVRRALKVRWYRCPIDKEELRQLMQRMWEVFLDMGSRSSLWVCIFLKV